MKKVIAFVFLIVLLVNNQLLLAQGKTPEEQAMYALSRSNFDEAIESFELLREQGGSGVNVEHSFYLGYAYFMTGNNLQALKYFSEVVENETKKSNRQSAVSCFFLGEINKGNGRYNEAIDYYKRYLRNLSCNDCLFNKERVEKEILFCETMMKLSDAGEKPVYPKSYYLNVGEMMNGEYLRLPTLSGNNSVLVFTKGSRNNLPTYSINAFGDFGWNSFDDIYMSINEGGVWSTPVCIDSQLGNNGEYVPVSISADGKLLFLIKEYMNGVGVYFSEYKNDRWTEAQKLSADYDYTLTGTCNGDDDIYYFCSSSLKKNDDLNIIACNPDLKEGRIIFSESGNGFKDSHINTKYQEDFVCYVNSEAFGKMLFFSSDRPGGFGGMDAYVSYYSDSEDNWKEPENLGGIFNTALDDYFVVIRYDNKILLCPQSMYHNGHRLNPDECFIFKEPQTPDEPLLSDNLTPNNNSELPDEPSAPSDDHVDIVQNNTEDPYVSQEVLSENEEMKVEGNQEAEFVVYFEFDKDAIDTDRYGNTLGKALNIMTANTHARVEVCGYTDRVGTEAYNLGLSKRRAEKVKAWLVKKGVDAQSIDLKYFGEGKPVSDANSALNRRVEIRIAF